ncbi:MAG TPA: NAD(P)-dependent oxidoreductase [Baekduia sp.]|uniref:NAD-dependent epimerase/dehydratase family protein n=1 Tax=Baekduia sp. TaxID=2600305 RepID=UPI002C0C422A|nr:NAD(P)-dependent oxidoreductase [Baekduia sp.]HMJ33091.1 NAD(P)-dependent oxidoreductase [Baekduia sp.]
MSRAALDAAAGIAAQLLEPLRGRAIHISGASGFLAANLVALLHEADRAGDLGLRLYASARRPVADVALFEFLEVTPEVVWEVAPVERAALPSEPGLIAVHAASFGAPKDYLREPVATFRANTDGLVEVFAQAARHRAGHVVYFSSAEVYGQPPAAAIPTGERFAGGPDLGSPRSIYAESKRMAEVLGVTLSAEYDLPFTAVRPFNLYGPGQRLSDGRVPLEFMRLAVEQGAVELAGDGTPTRSPCFVFDGLLQVVACLSPATETRAYNIGDPTKELTMGELARRCAAVAGLDAEAVGMAAEPANAGLARAVPDVSAVMALTARAPAPFTPLDDGLRALRSWVQWAGVHA